MQASKLVLIALIVLGSGSIVTAQETKTGEPAKTAEHKTTEPEVVDSKTEQATKAEAAQKVQTRRDEAEKKKALSDATALSQIDEEIARFAERVGEAVQKGIAAKAALDKAVLDEKAAADSVEALGGEVKKLQEAATAAEKAAKDAEALAKAEKATEAEKKAAIEARAAATKATKALEEKQAALAEAEKTSKAAAAKRKQAEEEYTKLNAKAEELSKKLGLAQEGRKAQKRWMANRIRPDLPLDELSAFLLPLTKDQLQEEAARWLEAVQSKVSAIGATELALKRNKGELDKETDEKKKEELQTMRDDRQKTLVKFQDERAKLVDRTRAILTELAAKGGDKAKIDEYELYMKAVSGLRLQAGDARGATIALWSWVKSDEGGVRWAKNIGKFLATLFAFWVLSIVASGTARRALGASRFSTLLQHSLSGLLKRVIMIIGFVVGLSMLEVNINPLLAALGGAAIVVGLALQGTLANFASGMLIMGYRPFDEGDVVEIGGVTGKVSGLSMLSTTLVTGDNRTVIVPNGSVWNGTIVNLSAKPTRRVDMVFGIGYEDDMGKAHDLMTEVVTSHEKVLKDPAPVIRVHELADSSVNFVVRPWTKTADYWGVYWDLHRAIKERFDAEGISIPFPQRDVHVHQVEASAPPAPTPTPGPVTSDEPEADTSKDAMPAETEAVAT